MAHLGGSSSAEIDAPLEEVWAIVEDVITTGGSTLKAVANSRLLGRKVPGNRRPR